MQVPGFRYLSSPFHFVWEKANQIKKSTKNFAVRQVETRIHQWNQSDFWQKHGKSLYTRYIQPLDKTDYTCLSGSVALASAISFFSIQFFVAFFPLAMAGNACMVFGAGAYSRSRVRQHFNEIAWKHVNDIRKTTHKINYANPHFGDINQYKASLEKPEFEHLKNDLKELETELNKFREIVINPSYEKKQKAEGVQYLEDSRKGFIEYLKGLQSRLAPYKKVEDGQDIKDSDPKVNPPTPTSKKDHEDDILSDEDDTSSVTPSTPSSPKNGDEIQIQVEEIENTPQQTSPSDPLQIQVQGEEEKLGNV